MASVLFISEQYCDANPNFSISSNFHTFIPTLAKYVNPNYQFIPLEGDSHVDFRLKDYQQKNIPDIVFISYLGASNLNPSDAVLLSFQQLGSKICPILHDTVWDWAKGLIQRTSQFADLIISLDGHSEFGFEVPCPVLNLNEPRDEDLFYPAEKTIDISFVGALQGGYTYRPKCIKYLIDNGLDIVISGGHRENKLTSEEYARLIRSSRMTINFSESPTGNQQLKGRVFEALASATLLLESANPITQQFLRPGIEYAQFHNEHNLLNLIKWHLDNPSLIEIIAQNGYYRYIDDYRSELFWKRVLEKLILC